MDARVEHAWVDQLCASRVELDLFETRVKQLALLVFLDQRVRGLHRCLALLLFFLFSFCLPPEILSDSLHILDIIASPEAERSLNSLGQFWVVIPVSTFQKLVLLAQLVGELFLLPLSLFVGFPVDFSEKVLSPFVELFFGLADRLLR